MFTVVSSSIPHSPLLEELPEIFDKVIKLVRYNFALVGKVRLDYGEGITGAAVKEMRMILDNHPPANPHYKFFHGLREEMYDAFCVAPILRGIGRIGALAELRDGGKLIR